MSEHVYRPRPTHVLPSRTHCDWCRAAGKGGGFTDPQGTAYCSRECARDAWAARQTLATERLVDLLARWMGGEGR